MKSFQYSAYLESNIQHKPFLIRLPQISYPVPGLISGGPNKRFPYPVTSKRLGDTPPARYFLDETPSADTNEIAVYWNSITILVAAFFNQPFKEE